MKRTLLTIALAAVASSAFAAKPTSMIYAGKAIDEQGNKYINYDVKCSNGKVEQMTAWNNRRLWCPGTTQGDDCSRKQIKAAKQTCKAS